MNKKLVIYILLASATLQPASIIATPQKTTAILSTQEIQHDHDELECTYNQQEFDNQEAMSQTQMPEWVVSLSLAVLLKYFALKDYMSASWARFKQTIARKN